MTDQTLPKPNTNTVPPSGQPVNPVNPIPTTGNLGNSSSAQKPVTPTLTNSSSLNVTNPTTVNSSEKPIGPANTTTNVFSPPKSVNPQPAQQPLTTSQPVTIAQSPVTAMPSNPTPKNNMGFTAPISTAPTSSSTGPQANLATAVKPASTTSTIPSQPAMAAGIGSGGNSLPPKPPASASPISTPPPAAPRKSILRFLPFILIGVILFAAVGGLAYWWMNRADSNPTTNNPSNTPQPESRRTTVTYWGLWEPTTVMEEVINEFEDQNPQIDIQYTQQSHQEYLARLKVAIASSTGPDLFRYHATWVPMLREELAPLPEKIMTAEEYSNTFYPVATTSLTLDNNIVGIPLMYEGLGLYYNKQIFEVANLAPPTTWEELKTVAEQLTVRSGTTISRGGIALGTTSNVDNFSDILGLMLYQNGAKISDPIDPEGKGIDAVDFYQSFSNTLQVWDDSLPNSSLAFSRGDVAMIIAPSWRVHEIKARNPNLEFGIVPVPQLEGTERTTWASFWAEGVSSKSSNKDAAWQFLEYMSSPEVLRKLHAEASQERAFGELYPRQDMAEELINDEYQGAYLQDAPYARTGFLSSLTHDKDINDRIISFYEEALNSTSSNTARNLETVRQGVVQVLQQYFPGTGL